MIKSLNDKHAFGGSKTGDWSWTPDKNFYKSIPDFHFKAILFNTVSNKYLIDLIFLVSWTLLAVFLLNMGINKIKNNMKSIAIFIYEWKHFIRSPFKIVSIILFIIAAVYGLHNGANLYQDQISEIDNITVEVNKEIAEITSYYDKENPTPEGRSWVDLTLQTGQFGIPKFFI